LQSVLSYTLDMNKSITGLALLVISALASSLLLTHKVITIAILYMKQLPALSIVDLVIGVGAAISIGVLILRLKTLKEEIYKQNQAFIEDLEKRDKRIDEKIENLSNEITTKFNNALKIHMEKITNMVETTQGGVKDLKAQFNSLDEFIRENAFQLGKASSS